MASSFVERDALRGAAVDVALEEGVARAADQRRDARPLDTKNSNLPRQAEFTAWIARKVFRGGSRVTGAKLCLFPQEDAGSRCPKKRKRCDWHVEAGEPSVEGGGSVDGEESNFRLSVSTTKGSVSAIKDLWVYQNTVEGHAATEDLRADEGVRAVLDTFSRRASTQTKDNYRLIGAGSLSEGLGPVTKRREIATAWLRQGTLRGLRNRAIFAVCYDSALQGEDARGLELGYLSFHF